MSVCALWVPVPTWRMPVWPDGARGCRVGVITGVPVSSSRSGAPNQVVDPSKAPVVGAPESPGCCQEVRPRPSPAFLAAAEDGPLKTEGKGLGLSSTNSSIPSPGFLSHPLEVKRTSALGREGPTGPRYKQRFLDCGKL